MRGRQGSVAVLALAGVLVCAAPAVAQEQVVLPANDLNILLSLTGVETPTPAPLQHNAEPPLEPVPRARCRAGSRPLEGMQGRVPQAAIDSPEAEKGWTCNVTEVGHLAAPGGFRTWRYVDTHGNECAFFDTGLLHPFLAATIPGAPSTGVAVLDMSDPAHPVQTDLLDSLPMQAPHESLNLDPGRGLLAAEMGNGGTAPGLMSVYDASQDCRHPVEKATELLTRFGHESGFSPDGKTFWMDGGQGLAAVDVSNPGTPFVVWQGNEYTHGLTVSDDGNRAYVADPINGNLTILDVSEIQARKPDPHVREVSRLTWDSVAIPQNTAPMTIDGHPYLLEFDEFNFRFTAIPQDLHTVGAARIIDIADEAHPRVVSNLRLEVNQHDTHEQVSGDPAPTPVENYGAHYCAIPREIDPQIVACTFINSGLRIFDIRDPLHPREAAYFVSPPEAGQNSGLVKSDFAMSQPAFAPERREVWYTDGTSGFWAVRLDDSVWPNPLPAAGPPCAPKRVTLRFHGRPALRHVRATIAGERARARRHGRGAVRVRLHPARRDGTFTLRVRAVTRSGRHVKLTRRFRACGAR